MASTTYPADKYTPKVGEVCELLSCSNPHSQWHNVTVLYIDSEVTVYKVDSYTNSFNQPTRVLAFRKIESDRDRFVGEFKRVDLEWRGPPCQRAVVDLPEYLYAAGFRYTGETK